MTDTLYKIKVMQAWEDGKEIRYYVDSGECHKLFVKKMDGNPVWDWVRYNYEIARDTVYANIYKSGEKVFHNDKSLALSLLLDINNALRVAVKYEEVIE